MNSSLVLLVTFAVAFVLAVAAVGAQVDPGPPPPATTIQADSSDYWRERAGYWHGKAVKRLRLAFRLETERNGYRRMLLARPSVTEAINLACTVYGHCTELWRKADCETGGTFDPRSKNRHSSASGLFQFLTSTWARTPFARFSIWNPYPNALAAGWMHANGRGGEWQCQ